MVETPPGPAIDATQELASDATRDHVIVGGDVQRDELVAGIGMAT